MKLNHDPVKRPNLSDNLIERLVELIQVEGLAPGDRLPSIMKLTQRFGVGHATLREALRKLEAIGVVTIKHGSGVYLHRTPDRLLMSNPLFGGTVSKKLVLDLIEARIPIEVTTARLAASTATEAQIEKMSQLMEMAEKHLNDDDILSPANLDFHSAIAAASGNVVMAQLLDVLVNLFKREQRMILSIYRDRKKDHEEHKGILEAIKLKDEILAEERMRSHLEGVRAVLLQWDPKRRPVS